LVNCNAHKYDILSKTPEIFINEDLTPQDQAKLRNEVQKVKEVRNEGKWTIIRTRKDIVRDRDQNANNINSDLDLES